MALYLSGIATDCYSHVMLEDAGATTGQQAYLANCFNWALEEMRVLSPQTFRRTIDLTWTGGVACTATIAAATAASFGSPVTVASAGSTVQLTGDNTLNELAARFTGTAANLLFPYTGTLGTTPATVYGDCLTLGVDTAFDAFAVDHVLGCNILHERRPLVVVSSRDQWMMYQGYWQDRDYGSRSVELPMVRQPGVPRALWLETAFANDTIEYRAHVAPLPNGTFRATMDVETLATDVTTTDLTGNPNLVTVSGTAITGALGSYYRVGNALSYAHTSSGGGVSYYIVYVSPTGYYLTSIDGGNVWLKSGDSTSVAGSYLPQTGAVDTAIVTTSGGSRAVPGQRAYGILRALVLYHWSNSPWFRNDSARSGINAAYADAIGQLKGFRPDKGTLVRAAIVY